MQPRIEKLLEKKLVGQRRIMSLTNNETKAMWYSFMDSRHKIENAVGTDLYSVQIYDQDFFHNFSPTRQFEKWATAEVSDFLTVPSEMETLMLPEGLYAVFHYKGPASAGAKMFQYIFQTWLPNADYVLDNRPHFELLGSKYKNDDPLSEEEFWIPVKPKP